MNSIITIKPVFDPLLADGQGSYVNTSDDYATALDAIRRAMRNPSLEGAKNMTCFLADLRDLANTELPEGISFRIQNINIDPERTVLNVVKIPI